MTSSIRREAIPVTTDEASILDRLTDTTSVEHRALAELVPEAAEARSRAALAHHVLAIGMQALREKVLEEGYAALAASYTDADRGERRAEARTRRTRLAAARGEE